MSLKDTWTSAWEAAPAAIASGASLSPVLNLGGLRLFAIVMPSGWTAANLTFQMSPDGGATWANIKDQNGVEITAMASALDCLILDPKVFAPIQYLRLRSGTAASPVVQTAARTLSMILRAV
ncbi:MAG: hypothetical protein PHW76_01845 [Alphaproteobacteria bacterium]|nr:hypothetical protein [Alphaproteobacteria bacterium]